MSKRELARSQKGAWFYRGLLPLTLLFLLIELFDKLPYGVESAISPALRDSLGLSYAQMGLLLGLPGVIGTGFEFFLMLLRDTRLRKWLIIGGGLAIAMATLLLASAQSFAAALLAIMIASLPGRSGTVMAINSLMGVLGGMLVWFVGWSAGQAGLQAAMWLLIAGPVALALFVPKTESPRQASVVK